MARQRDYKAENARRELLARERGEGSAYQRRVRGVAFGERGRARGHAGETRAFLRSLREGDLILCDITAVESRTSYRMVDVSSSVPDKRFKSGRRPVVRRRRVRVQRYVEIVKTVIPAGPGPNRDWSLRNLSRAELLETIEAEIQRGVEFSPSPSTDQRRLLDDDEVTGGY